MNTKKINIVVVGCSPMGEYHINGVLKKEDANLYAICDSATDGRLEKCQEKYNVTRAVKNYEELVNDPNVDAAVLVVPDQVHLKMATDFMRAGKDVLCEKPMALSMEECAQMMQVEKETGRKLMVGQVCRFTPSFVKVKELIDSGRIGDLYFVESEYAHDYGVSPGYDSWRVTPEREGFIGGGCHAVDLLRWIAGNPTEVSAYANHKCLTDWPVNDATVAIYQFPNDVIGKVFVSIGCNRDYTMRSAFYGTKGTILCDNTSPSITLFECKEERINGKRAYTQPQEIPVEVDNHNVVAEIDMFVDALLEGKAVPISSTEGAATVAVCRATVESSVSKQPVSIKYLEN